MAHSFSSPPSHSRSIPFIPLSANRRRRPSISNSPPPPLSSRPLSPPPPPEEHYHVHRRSRPWRSRRSTTSTRRRRPASIALAASTAPTASMAVLVPASAVPAPGKAPPLLLLLPILCNFQIKVDFLFGLMDFLFLCSFSISVP